MTVQILALCTGASLGALARWQLGLWLSQGQGQALAWGTLAANWIGAYLIGLLVGLFQWLPQLDPLWRLALITGFLGALTTFSSFSAEVIGLLQAQRYVNALLWSALNLVGSLFLTAAGLFTLRLVRSAF